MPDSRPVDIELGKEQSSIDQAELNDALQKLERALGGRLKIATALRALAAPTREESRVADFLADPSYRSRPLRSVIVAADPQMTLGKLLALFRDGRMALAFAKTTEKMARGVARTAAHLMETSVPHRRDCKNCDGLGTKVTKKKGPAPCSVCKGKGHELHYPETARIELALRAAGLPTLQQDHSTKIANVTNIGATVVQTSAAFLKATDRLLREVPVLPAGSSEPSFIDVTPAEPEAETVEPRAETR